jgi:hypothetical protein
VGQPNPFTRIFHCQKQAERCCQIFGAIQRRLQKIIKTTLKLNYNWLFINVFK